MNLRQLATQVLVKVLKDGQSLTAALDAVLAAVELPKDRAFIQAMCYGVMRDYHCLDFVLSQLLGKPLRNKDTDIKVLMLMGLHQLRAMRVKDHAAVSETVAAIGKKSWAKSVINAVLRRYLREQESLAAQIEKDPVALYSHPAWLVGKLNKNWAEQAQDLMLENNRQPPMILRVNLRHCTQTEYLKLLQREEIEAEIVAISETAIKLTQAVTVELLPKFSQGWVSVQDTAAQFAAPLLDAKEGMTVLDMCAAPGGKTASMLERQIGLKVTAIDIDEKRLQRVNENLQRLNLKAEVIVADASQPDSWWNGKPFERILVDAPCSALGVIRRHPDIKFLRRPEDINVLQALQQQILAAAWKMLASGGVLLYATCSVLKQENEKQVLNFLAEHSDSFEIPIDADWGIQQAVGRQILTGQHGMDGFYYARLGKR